MKLIVAIIAALCALPRPQEKIELKFRPKQGDKLKSTEALTMKVEGKITSGAEERDFALEQRTSKKATKEYVQVADGKATKVVLDVEEDVAETKPPLQTEFQRTEQPLHGKKVTLTLKDGQTVIEGIDNPDKKTKKSLKLEDDFSKAFPKGPVAPGDSWEISGKDVQELLSDENVDGKITLKLTEVKEIEKRKCAVIAASFDLKGKTDEGVDLAMKVTGFLIVWIERGYTLSVTLKGTVKMKLENDRMKLAGEGPMTIETESKP